MSQDLEAKIKELERENRQLKADLAAVREPFGPGGPFQLDRPPTGQLSHDRQWRILNANDDFLAWSGYNREELLGQPLYDFLENPVISVLGNKDNAAGGETLSDIRRIFLEMEGTRGDAQMGNLHFLEALFRARGGKKRPVRLVLYFLGEEDRQHPIHAHSLLHALETGDPFENLIQLKSVAIDAAANGILITDPGGKIRWVNPALCSMTGYSSEELLGQNPRIWKSERHDKAFYEDLWNTILSGEVWTGNLVNRRRDGSFFNEKMTITPVTNGDGKILNFIAIKEDVSDRKHIQDELERSENQFRERIQNIHGYIFDTVYEHGDVVSTYHSPKCVEITGYSVEEYSENHHLWWQMVYEEDREKVNEFAQRKGETDGILTVEHRIRTKDGEIRWISNTTTISRNEDGEIIRETGFVEDITHRKNVEEELNRYRRNLEKMVMDRTKELNRALDLKGEFLSRVSHELRTPLNSILVLSQGMLQKPEGNLSDKYAGYLSIVEKCGRNLLKMINEILEISKMESGKFNLESREFDLCPLVEEVVISIRPLATEKGLELEIQPPDQNLRMKGDRERVQQVISNIISNAVKYTENGGVRIGCREEDGKIEIAVTDTGLGMGPEEQKRIFEEFYRAPEAVRQGEQGTGLGLTIASKFTRMMGGEIRVESQPGVGSTFYIQLPLSPGGQTGSEMVRVIPPPRPPVDSADAGVTAEVPGPGEPDLEQAASKGEGGTVGGERNARTPGEGGRTARILVVEDNPENFYTLRFLLEDTRCPIFQAETGAKGLQLAQTLKPDIILLDINLPDISGYDVFREIRTWPEFDLVPIVAVTAKALDSDREEIQRLGFSDYIVKPIDTEQFQQVMDRRLREIYDRQAQQG